MSIDSEAIRSEPHPEIGNLLRRNIGLVIDRWSRRAVEEQPNAARVHQQGAVVDGAVVHFCRCAPDRRKVSLIVCIFLLLNSHRSARGGHFRAAAIFLQLHDFQQPAIFGVSAGFAPGRRSGVVILARGRLIPIR